MQSTLAVFRVRIFSWGPLSNPRIFEIDPKSKVFLYRSSLRLFPVRPKRALFPMPRSRACNNTPRSHERSQPRVKTRQTGHDSAVRLIRILPREIVIDIVNSPVLSLPVRIARQSVQSPSSFENCSPAFRSPVAFPDSERQPSRKFRVTSRNSFPSRSYNHFRPFLPLSPFAAPLPRPPPRGTPATQQNPRPRSHPCAHPILLVFQFLFSPLALRPTLQAPPPCLFVTSLLLPLATVFYITMVPRSYCTPNRQVPIWENVPAALRSPHRGSAAATRCRPCPRSIDRNSNGSSAATSSSPSSPPSLCSSSPAAWPASCIRWSSSIRRATSGRCAWPFSASARSPSCSSAICSTASAPSPSSSRVFCRNSSATSPCSSRPALICCEPCPTRTISGIA